MDATMKILILICFILTHFSMAHASDLEEEIPCKQPQIQQPLNTPDIHFFRTLPQLLNPREEIPKEVEKFYNKKCPDVNPITGAALKISWPLKHSPVRMSRGFKKNHAGCDFPAKRGTDVYAAQDGVITYVGDRDDGYGTKILIEGTYGWTTLYAHLSRVNKAVARRGAQVLSGDLIGFVGDTGDSSGYHLHFEIQEKILTKDASAQAVEHLVPRDPFCFLEERDDIIHE